MKDIAIALVMVRCGDLFGFRIWVCEGLPFWKPRAVEATGPAHPKRAQMHSKIVLPDSFFNNGIEHLE